MNPVRNIQLFVTYIIEGKKDVTIIRLQGRRNGYASKKRILFLTG